MSPNQDLIPSTAVVSICLRMVTFNQWAWNYQVSISEAICHIVPSVPFAKLLQSCPTLCNPIDGSPPGSPVLGILQARTLEWVAISFSSAWKWKVKVKSLSLVQLLATPWTAAYQAPPSMGFFRQEYWSGVPLPSPIIHLNTSKCLSISTLSLSLVFPWKMSCQDDMVWPTFNKLTYFSTAVEYIIFLVGLQWGDTLCPR